MKCECKCHLQIGVKFCDSCLNEHEYKHNKKCECLFCIEIKPDYEGYYDQ